MEADWAVELAADDPAIVVPWHADADLLRKTRALAFVDLRKHPEAVATIHEATASPELRSALLTLNSDASPVWTAKCDFWEEACDLGPLELDASEAEALYCVGSYIDLLMRDEDLQGSFENMEGWMRRACGKLHAIELRCARTDFVLRRAAVYESPGFGVTWFVIGCGRDIESARNAWRRTLDRTLPWVMCERSDLDGGDDPS